MKTDFFTILCVVQTFWSSMMDARKFLIGGDRQLYIHIAPIPTLATKL